MTLPDRFWSKVNKTESCWVWTAAQKGKGYGSFGDAGRQWRVHRLAYERLVGPIPDGLVLDHLCRNRLCVKPAHMEVVTPAENNRRGNSPSARAARKTHCVNGHEFTPENTRVERRPDGSLKRRRCRVCWRAIERRRDARRRARRRKARESEAA